MISIKNLNKTYITEDESLHVLKNINIDIKKGEFVSIMGASGSGKSTLIKILGLLDKDYTGEYTFYGSNTKDFTDDQKSEFVNNELGFVFQDFNLIKRLTVFENIVLPALYQGKKAKDLKKDVQSLLDNVELKHKLDSYPTELSGGQQQRISITRALINNPSLIIADEPTGALDSKSANSVLKIFQDLNKKGITLIFVTHDINIAKYADRIIYIKDGEVSEEG